MPPLARLPPVIRSWHTIHGRAMKAGGWYAARWPDSVPSERVRSRG
jgi:hypothetical protein